MDACLDLLFGIKMSQYHIKVVKSIEIKYSTYIYIYIYVCMFSFPSQKPLDKLLFFFLHFDGAI